MMLLELIILSWIKGAKARIDVKAVHPGVDVSLLDFIESLWSSGNPKVNKSNKLGRGCVSPYHLSYITGFESL